MQLGLMQVLLLIILGTLTSCGNHNVEKQQKSNYIIGSSTTKVFNDKSIIDELYSNDKLVKIIDFLPENFNENAEVDYTNIVQEVLNTYPIIEFPNFPLLINDKGLEVRSNSSLIFNEHSLLKLQSSDKIFYTILNLTDVENVTLFSPKIEGDRYRRIDRDSQEGEWGMGIFINASKNIVINNAAITKCWGDGIYIGGCNKELHNENIQIINPVIDDIRRNGISITCGKQISLMDAHISNCRGKAPESGIDIEPNYNSNIIEDILIKNAYTFNNANIGIVLSLEGLVGKDEKEVGIRIENHVDEYSKYGFVLASHRKEREPTDKKLEGKISLINCHLKYNTTRAFVVGISRGLFPLIKITSPEIYSLKDDKDFLDMGALQIFKSLDHKSDVIFK
jgi:hypothetical protein